MADKLPVLHTTYNFKPKNANGYVKIYFECSPQDIIIEDSDKDKLLNSDNLLQLLTQLVTLANNAQNKVLMTWSYSIDKSEVFPRGQIIYEQDTGVIRIGDGNSTYENLGHAKPAITAEEVELDESIEPIFVFNQDGSETTVNLGTTEAKNESETPAEDATSVFITNN